MELSHKDAVSLCVMLMRQCSTVEALMGRDACRCTYEVSSTAEELSVVVTLPEN